MKVVVAIDSFKGSLSSMEAGNAVKSGILSAKPNADVLVRPLADGGEGTTDALIDGLNGERIELTVTGPLGAPVHCHYGYLTKERTAVIEMASAAGLTLVTKKDPLRASTYGVGEMILDALDRGYRNFIIGIGGSATNDGGIGMLKALGYSFLDKNGEDSGEGAQALGRIARICGKCADPRLASCHFQIACDVTNPLCGKQGATYVYGPQKGVTEGMKDTIDQSMRHFAEIAEAFSNRHTSLLPGAGAAGGLGFAFLTFLPSILTPGIDLIMEIVGLEKEFISADVVVTGEGRLDAQTAMGKAPMGVARLAKKHGAVVLAFAGSVTDDAVACNTAGIDAFFPVIRGITTLSEAMKPDTARRNISQTVEQVFRLL
ncbi:MAG: glycerate kinase [Eubacteriales bacterium]|nr:glycerate kinase [Eubacteriales bacterium]